MAIFRFFFVPEWLKTMHSNGENFVERGGG